MSNQQLHEYLRAVLSLRSSYHDHKEQMATAAATLYIGGALTLMANPVSFGLRVVIFVYVSVMAFAFVTWQLYNRRQASFFVTACLRLMARLLTEEHGDLELNDPNGVWPKALAKEIESVRRAGGEWPGFSMPLIAMAVAFGGAAYSMWPK